MEQKLEKKQLTFISNFRNKNEKASWLRKKRNLEALVKDLDPIQQQILELNYQKNKIVDDITAIRNEMVKECIHPIDYLVHHGTYVMCRFCETKLRLVSNEN